MHHAAIEKHMRRARQTARAAPHQLMLRSRRLLSEEPREVPRDRRILRVGQPHFLQSRAPRNLRHVGALRGRQKSVEYLLDLFAVQLGL